MKNVFKLFRIIVVTAIIGFSIVSCGDSGDGDGSGSHLLWREELEGDWYGRARDIYFGNGYDFRRPVYDGKGNIVGMELHWTESYFSVDGSEYTLISKSDKPTSQESSFTVKDVDDKKITVKYTLGVNVLNITSPSNFAGTYTK